MSSVILREIEDHVVDTETTERTTHHHRTTREIEIPADDPRVIDFMQRALGSLRGVKRIGPQRSTRTIEPTATPLLLEYAGAK